MQLKSIVKRPLRVLKTLTPKSSKSKLRDDKSVASIVIGRDDVKPIAVDLTKSRPSDVTSIDEPKAVALHREPEPKPEPTPVVETKLVEVKPQTTEPEVKPQPGTEPEQEEQVPEVQIVTDDSSSHGHSSESHSSQDESNDVTEDASRSFVMVPSLHIVEPTPASTPIASVPPSPVVTYAPAITAITAPANPLPSVEELTRALEDESAKRDTVDSTVSVNETMDATKTDAELPVAPSIPQEIVMPEGESQSPQPTPAPVAESSALTDDESHATDINPFIIDDAELSSSDREQTISPVPPAVSKETTMSPQSTNTDADLPPIPADVNKDVPSPPKPASESGQEEEPVVVAPGLTSTSLFLPIPNTDPLTSLLIKHIPEVTKRPPRDVSGEWQHSDFNTLVMTNNWRALARMARDRIVSSNPTDIHTILSLWYIRLSSLARMRLFNQCTAECDNLFTALAGVSPPQIRAYVIERILPFELEVLRARCVYWSGDPIGYLDELSALHRRCRVKARQSKDEDDVSMWKERGARMSLIIASQLVEMKDFYSAASLLESLCAGTSSTPALRSAIARIYIQGGNISAATTHFSIVENDPDADANTKAMNAMVLAAANGEWDKSSELARQLLEEDEDNVAAYNNYAVAMLGQGHVKEAIDMMESVLQTSPSAVTTAEPFLFNLSTLYELRSSTTLSKKRNLLVEVAKWSGDGLKTTCLKMPN